jgi:hypothetical protein
MLFTTGDAIKVQSELIRLWMHEATRVYSDKLVDSSDNENFQKLIMDVIKKNCEVHTFLALWFVKFELRSTLLIYYLLLLLGLRRECSI